MGVINVEEIPKSEGNIIGSMLYTAMTQFYADTENQAAFEKWMAQRQQENGTSKGHRIKREVIKCSTGLNTLMEDAATLQTAGKT